jgi:molybdopterin-guanine dinucleotide biosynthesis protein A
MNSQDKHHAHGRIVKPDLGDFGRNELVIYGTTCDNIKNFVAKIQGALKEFDIAYVDADHHHSSVANTSFQEKDNSFEVAYPCSSSAFIRRSALSQSDAILINGNHFQGKSQIIICDGAKEQSLRKRAAQLHNVVAVITLTKQETVPDYVYDLVPMSANIPVLHLDTFGDIVVWYKSHFLRIPPIHVLILAGGRSIRMGMDKTMIKHHGKPQTPHLAELVNQLGIPAYVSCRVEQQEHFETLGLNSITDRISDIGPLGGIISAFMNFPDHAWLVLASDIPLIDDKVITTLLNQRNPNKNATAYQSISDGFPEPLIAIWEPKSYPTILSFLAQGYSCPRKVLINSNIQTVVHQEAEKLINVNTPEDLKKINDMLRHHP